MGVYGDEEDGEVAAGAALVGLEEGERDGVENVDCGGPVFGFDVAGGDYAGLLLGFVVLRFCDSGLLLAMAERLRRG